MKLININENINARTTTICTHRRTDYEWDENINQVALAIRTAVHESTEFSPYFINHGRNYISSGDEYSRIRETNGGTEQEAEKLGEDMRIIFEKVKLNLKKAYDRYGKYYNLR